MVHLKTLLSVPGLYHFAAFLTARRVVVRGESMVPTLLAGERVLFDTLAYHLGEPRRDDIVLATHPDRPGRVMVKRISGIPGDEVDGKVLGNGEYWLLGDMPQFSTDSRELGPFRREDLVGRGWWVYWPARDSRRVR